MKHPLSGLVARQPDPKHEWRITERPIPGAKLKLHACTKCKPAHVKAYDMEIINSEAFLGRFEYEQRSVRI